MVYINNVRRFISKEDLVANGYKNATAQLQEIENNPGVVAFTLLQNEAYDGSPVGIKTSGIRTDEWRMRDKVTEELGKRGYEARITDTKRQYEVQTGNHFHPNIEVRYEPVAIYELSPLGKERKIRNT